MGKDPRIYGEPHPVNIMDTFGYKNIWIDGDDLERHGALIISRHADEVETFARQACPYLSVYDVIVPQEYRFTVRNALNMPREYTIYYYIVPPLSTAKILNKRI